MNTLNKVRMDKKESERLREIFRKQRDVYAESTWAPVAPLLTAASEHKQEISAPRKLLPHGGDRRSAQFQSVHQVMDTDKTMDCI